LPLNIFITLPFSNLKAPSVVLLHRPSAKVTGVKSTLSVSHHKPMKAEEDANDVDSGGSSIEVKLGDVPYPLSPSSNVSTPSYASIPSTSLTTWPYTLLTPPLLVSPCQLVKRPSSPTPSSTEPPARRVKRKMARTEEEKEANAYERSMRNRRAAQESRDRRKRQLEALEEENRRLQEENVNMKLRIEQLEAQKQSSDTIDPKPTYSSQPVLKAEVFSPERFESTFHPAAMEYDQQCPSSSLKITSTPTLMSVSTCSVYNPLYFLWTNLRLQRLFSTLSSSTTQISSKLARSPATSNSLNICSLFLGAENVFCKDSRHCMGFVV
jgi:hypothetical protein